MGEMTLKTYAVRDTDYESGCVVFAATRGKAHRLGVSELDEEWTNVRVKRAPEFDDLAPGPLNPRDYIERGYWTVCVCGSQCHPDVDGTVIDGTEVYCSERCQQRAGKAVAA